MNFYNIFKILLYIVYFLIMSQIKDYLYLGSLNDSNNEDFLKNNNIKTIINVTYNHDNIKYDNIRYYKIDTLDSIEQPILYVIDKVNYLIKNNKNNGNILVHCYVGKSRSATCIIGYLIENYNMNLNESFKYVKDKRPIINPNNGFMNQLLIYENRKNNKIEKKQIVLIIIFLFILLLINI